MKNKNHFWVATIILFLFITGNMLIIHQQPPKANAQTHENAPEFKLSDLNGKPFRFSNLKGKVVILDFWATWCPPCRAEIPHFKSLYQEYKEKGLEVVGIALDQGGANTVKPFVKDFEINYPVLIGNQQVTEDYGGIRGIPTTFVIDRKGRIVGKFVGYRDKEVFESVIKELL